jgi:hypothetical protein
MNKHKVIVKSPLYEGITHTFIMTDDQLFIYNQLTNNGNEEMTLKLFGELTRKGCLKKLYFEKKKKISIK